MRILVNTFNYSPYILSPSLIVSGGGTKLLPRGHRGHVVDLEFVLSIRVHVFTRLPTVRQPEHYRVKARVKEVLTRQIWVLAKDSAGATDTLALAQDERCVVGGQTRIGDFQSAGPLTLAEVTRSGSGGDACSTGGRPRGSKRSKDAASQAKALERGARVIEVLRCKRLRVYRKLATRADHRTNPSATYIDLGMSRRPSSTNLATTLELRPAMPAKPGGSGPSGAKDIKMRHHDDDQQCV
jgi:hypothetical protein